MLQVNKEWEGNSEARKTVKRLLRWPDRGWWWLARPNPRYSENPEHSSGVEITEEVVMEGVGTATWPEGMRNEEWVMIIQSSLVGFSACFSRCASWAKPMRQELLGLCLDTEVTCSHGWVDRTGGAGVIFSSLAMTVPTRTIKFANFPQYAYTSFIGP